MGEDRKTFKIKDGNLGEVKIADEVVVDVALNISYGYSIPEVSAKVQDRVKNAIENMTGLEVSVVNIRIASVDMGNNK